MGWEDGQRWKKNTSQKAVGMPAQVSKFGENKPFTNRNVCFGSRNKKYITYIRIYIYICICKWRSLCFYFGGNPAHFCCFRIPTSTWICRCFKCLRILTYIFEVDLLVLFDFCLHNITIEPFSECLFLFFQAFFANPNWIVQGRGI